MTRKTFSGPNTPVAITGPGGLGTPLGFQQITGLSTVKSLTVPTGATYAVISADSQAVRWRDDGTNPSGSIGMALAAGAIFTYAGNLAAIKFIEQAASAVLNVSYYSG